MANPIEPLVPTNPGWGRRFLMCPPDHFEVVYSINPWMHPDREPVDLDLAFDQWDRLERMLRAAGAEIELIDPAPGLPDLVFTANAGSVAGDRFVPARFRNPERRGETPHATEWFRRHGWTVVELPDSLHQEGAGDALPLPGGVGSGEGDAGLALLAGYGPRSDASAPAALGEHLGVTVHPVRLVDPRLYHLDIAYCPLDDRRAIVVPDAFDAAGRRLLAELVPEPLVVDLHDALSFCANSVVVGTTVVMPACPPAVGRRLEAMGFDVAVAPMSEFQKAGGACRCLTLALDVPAGSGAGKVAA